MEAETTEKELTDEEIDLEIEAIERGLVKSKTLMSWMGVTKREGYNDIAELYEQKFQRHTELGIQTNQIANYMVKRFTELGIKFSSTTLYEGLAQRYKLHTDNLDEDENDSRDGNETSSLNTEEENKTYIDIVDSQIELLKSFKMKLLHSHFLSKFEERELDESFCNMKATISITNDLLDDRQSVPLQLQHLLIQANIAQMNNFTGGLYVSKVKEWGANRYKEAKEKFKKLANIGKDITKKKETMTAKQLNKIIERRVRKVLDVLNPKNRDEAISIGMYGIKCPNTECGSYRVERTIDNKTFKMKNHCYACDNDDDKVKFASKCHNNECNFPFYTDVLEVMAQTAVEENGAMKSKCPRCETEAILPIHFLEKLKVIA